MMRSLSLLGLLAVIAGALAGDKSLDDLAGTYDMTSGERGGKSLEASKIEGQTVRFTKDKIIVSDTNKKEVHVAGYAIDTKEKPYRLTMVSEAGSTKGQKTTGLIEKDGETVRLIYALPGGEEPKGFSTKGKDQILIVMKAVKKDKKDKKR